MKQQRFTNARLAEEKNDFTAFMKGTAKGLLLILLGAFVFVAVLAAITAARPVLANQTDWHNNELSQQIQAETRCELKGGVFEKGVCLPPNLNPSIEKYVREYTAQKQAEINRTLEQK